MAGLKTEKKSTKDGRTLYVRLSHVCPYLLVGLGGLVENVFAIGLKIPGFKPAEDDES
jgi:hypothetical protein